MKYLFNDHLISNAIFAVLHWSGGILTKGISYRIPVVYQSSYRLISTYINTKMCVCVFVLGHFETDWDTRWHKVAFFPWKGSITIIFKMFLPFFYISLRFFCKFEERL